MRDHLSTQKLEALNKNNKSCLKKPISSVENTLWRKITLIFSFTIVYCSQIFFHAKKSIEALAPRFELFWKSNQHCGTMS